jgi:hypothetical protein
MKKLHVLIFMEISVKHNELPLMRKDFLHILNKALQTRPGGHLLAEDFPGPGGRAGGSGTRLSGAFATF